MDFFYIMIVFCASVLVVVATTIMLSIRSKSRGISKDYAEQAVLRRLKHGRTIGARFTKEKQGYFWEFDVSDGAGVYRVWVDAHTGALVKALDLRRVNTPPGNGSKMLGKRIG